MLAAPNLSLSLLMKTRLLLPAGEKSQFRKVGSERHKMAKTAWQAHHIQIDNDLLTLPDKT